MRYGLIPAIFYAPSWPEPGLGFNFRGQALPIRFGASEWRSRRYKWESVHAAPLRDFYASIEPITREIKGLRDRLQRMPQQIATTGNIRGTGGIVS